MNKLCLHIYRCFEVSFSFLMFYFLLLLSDDSLKKEWAGIFYEQIMRFQILWKNS